MKLSDFCLSVKADIEEFEAWYRSERERSSAGLWPLENGEPDWFEQFIVWWQHREAMEKP